MSDAIPSWARVGAKVVYLGPLSGKGRKDIPRLVEGDIYTIRSFYCVPLPWRDAGRWIVRVAEVTNPLDHDGEEGGYYLDHFRPLVSQAGDISTHFAHHLDTRAPELV